MTEKNIEILSLGHLQCDNSKCGYVSPSEVKDKEQLRSLIGTPCPDCGENLLTQDDYDATLEVFNNLEMIADMSEEDLMEMAKTHLTQNMTEDELDNFKKFIDECQDNNGNIVMNIHDSVVTLSLDDEKDTFEKEDTSEEEISTEEG